LKLFFPKGGTHYTDLPFRVLSSHAALTLALKGLTAARQIRSFFSSLLEKTIIQNAYALGAKLCFGFLAVGANVIYSLFVPCPFNSLFFYFQNIG
jgi:hypothetical protein